MEEIGLHNYEAWLLDYSDGALSDAQVAALGTFLLLHPELEIELDSLSLPHLDTEIEQFPNSGDLQKHFSPNEEAVLNYLENNLSHSEKTVFEMRLQHEVELRELVTAYGKTIVSADAERMPGKDNLLKPEHISENWPAALLYVESQLSAEAHQNFENSLRADADKQAELKLYAATKLQADLSVVHPNKDALYHSAKVVALFSFQQLRIAAAIILLVFFGFIIRFFTIDTEPRTNPKAPEMLAGTNALPKAIESNSITKITAVPKTLASVSAISTKPNVSSSNKEVAVQSSTLTNDAPIPSATPQPEPQFAQRTLPVPEATIDLNVQATVAANDNGTYYASVNDLQIGDDFSALDAPEKKAALWHKAVELARKVNRMGFTAVNGSEEQRGQRYFLSFNSITVEKK